MKTWSIDEKIRVLATASKLTGADLTALLEREGLGLADYEQWRLALAEEGVRRSPHQAHPDTRARAHAEREGAGGSRRADGPQKKVHRWREDEGDGIDEANES